MQAVVRSAMATLVCSSVVLVLLLSGEVVLHGEGSTNCSVDCDDGQGSASCAGEGPYRDGCGCTADASSGCNATCSGGQGESNPCS